MTLTMASLMIARLSKIFIACLLLAIMAVPIAYAQNETAGTPRFFEAAARSADAATVVAGKTTIELWGVQKIDGMSASFLVVARTALDNVIGSKKVRCELKSKAGKTLKAQCTNGEDLDLGLFMLQQGYVIADRSVVYGTVFEQPYIQAEMEAQTQGLGVWSSDQSGGGDSGDGNLMVVLGFVLFICILGAFCVLTVLIMKGFQKVIDAQNQNMDMVSRERQLRTKEREIFATMLDSEIKANKSKIEAYLVVYDEMLRDLKNMDRAPKYKKAGDIVQAQPALERSVFDRNTDKLDILGDSLSSEVIHFYARIKTKPDYINLEPDTPEDEALTIVEKAFKNGERINELADRLIDLFSQGGHASESYDF